MARARSGRRPGLDRRHPPRTCRPIYDRAQRFDQAVHALGCRSRGQLLVATCGLHGQGLVDRVPRTGPAGRRWTETTGRGDTGTGRSRTRAASRARSPHVIGRAKRSRMRLRRSPLGRDNPAPTGRALGRRFPQELERTERHRPPRTAGSLPGHHRLCSGVGLSQRTFPANVMNMKGPVERRSPRRSPRGAPRSARGAAQAETRPFDHSVLGAKKQEKTGGTDVWQVQAPEGMKVIRMGTGPGTP